jgi:hypothetical protein
VKAVPPHPGKTIKLGLMKQLSNGVLLLLLLLLSAMLLLMMPLMLLARHLLHLLLPPLLLLILLFPPLLFPSDAAGEHSAPKGAKLPCQP